MAASNIKVATPAAATDTAKVTHKPEVGTAPAEGKAVVFGKEGRELSFHPKLPYSYSVYQYDELYTVVQRHGIIKSVSGTRMQRFKQNVEYYKRTGLLLLRFSRETLGSLGKRRVLLYLLGDAIMATIPTWRSKAQHELAEVTRIALDTRQIAIGRMAKAALIDLSSWLLEQWVEEPLEKNKERLQYRYRGMVRAYLLRVRSKLDSVTASDERVKQRLQSAKALLATKWGQSFLLESYSQIVATTVGMVSEILLLRQLSIGVNRRFAIYTFFINSVFALRNQLRQRDFASYFTARTSPAYRRMQTMARLAEDNSQQHQLLDVGRYFMRQYADAAATVGDVSDKEPEVWSERFKRPFRFWFFGIANKVYHSTSFLLFAWHHLKNAETVGSLAAGVSDMEAVKSGSQQVLKSMQDLLKHVGSVHQFLEQVDQYYSVQDIEPLLKLSGTPATYAPSQISRSGAATPLKAENEILSEDGEATLVDEDISETRHKAMAIAFQNVSFTYPGTTRKALDNVSFTIKAGDLVSIVGKSGSGKSTLIALLVRLHDCDTGTILIDGIDIRTLDPQSLYKHVSMLFQSTPKANLTVREFVGLGNVDLMHDQEAIDKAIADAGADEIIKKLKYGLDTALCANHSWDDAISKELLLKRVQDFDTFLHQRAGLTAAKEQEDETKDESTDADGLRALRKATVGLAGDDAKALEARTKQALRFPLPTPLLNEAYALSDTAEADKVETSEEARFSGGEWSKVVLARSFLRSKATLTIVDEFSSALDPQSEAKIFSKLLERRGKSTMICITHRYHLACKSDLILVMKDGKLLETGTHTSLMSKPDSEYRAQYETVSKQGSGKDVAIQAFEEENNTTDPADFTASVVVVESSA